MDILRGGRMRQVFSSYVANNVKLLRKALGLKQKDFADFLGVNHSQYSKMERGVQSLSVCMICHLSERFNINPSWFFDRNHIDTNELRSFTSNRFSESCSLKKSNTSLAIMPVIVETIPKVSPGE